MRVLPTTSILLVVLVAGFALPTLAQDYPTRPVRIVTGAPATMMDAVSRQLALRLGELWDSPVVVDNRRMGAAFVSQAPQDGYTLLVADSGTLAIRPNLYRSLPYDAERDFAPIALLVSSPGMLIANPSVPATSLGAFIAYVKGVPGGVSFANAGPWTNGHLTSELFKRLTRLDLVHINYKGGAAATAAVVSGEAKAGFTVPFVSMPYVKAGKLRAYAVASRERFAGAPEIPTMAEAGAGELISTYWLGLLAPARSPQSLVQRLNREVVDLLHSPAMKSALLANGAEPGGGGPQEFAAFIRSETSRFRKVIEVAGFRAE